MKTYRPITAAIVLSLLTAFLIYQTVGIFLVKDIAFGLIYTLLTLLSGACVYICCKSTITFYDDRIEFWPWYYPKKGEKETEFPFSSLLAKKKTVYISEISNLKIRGTSVTLSQKDGITVVFSLPLGFKRKEISEKLRSIKKMKK